MILINLKVIKITIISMVYPIKDVIIYMDYQEQEKQVLQRL